MNNTDTEYSLQFELGQQIPESALALALNPPYGRTHGGDPVVRESVNPALNLVDGDIPEHRIYQAESFQRQLSEREKERQGKLQALYDELGRPDNIIVMMFCKNYFKMFENWLRSCEQNGINPVDRLIVFCLDQEAFDRATERGIKAYFFDPDYYAPAGKSKTFGDEWFRNTILYKNAVIAEALKIGPSVLFQDTDLVWLKDPFEYLDANRPHYDIQIMYDGPNVRGRPVYGNTGFIYLQCNEVTRSLFETGLRNSASILRAGAHQFVFMKIISYFLHHQMIRLHILPEHMFLNGHLFNLKRGALPPAGNWQREGIVLHHSWTGNRDEKFRKLKKFGLNYLDPEPENEPDKPEPTPSEVNTRESATEDTTDDLCVITLYLQGDESIDLACEKTNPILASIMKAYFQYDQRSEKPEVIHLQLMEDDEMYDLFLKSSQITRIEISPPLDPQTLSLLID